jgi:hypothetical protein
VAGKKGGDLFDPALYASVEDLSPALRAELMSLSQGLRAAAEKIDKLTQRKSAKELDENQEPTFRYLVKTLIPDDFYITKKMAKYALDKGMSEASIKFNAQNFVNYYRKSGKKWQDWSRVWQDWVRRSIEKSSTGIVTSDKLRKW